MTRRARKNNGHIQARTYNLCRYHHFTNCYLFDGDCIRRFWMGRTFVCCNGFVCSLLGINVWLVVWFPARRKPCRVNRFQGTLAGYLTNNSTLSLICLFVICLFRLSLFPIWRLLGSPGRLVAWRERRDSNPRSPGRLVAWRTWRRLLGSPGSPGLRGALGRDRTCDQRIRNPLLYPLSYECLIIEYYTLPY